MLSIEDPTVTMKCRTAIKAQFRYFDYCLRDDIYRCWLLWITCPKRLLDNSTFQYFDSERTSYKLFQKRTIPAKLDIYVFIRYW